MCEIAGIGVKVAACVLFAAATHCSRMFRRTASSFTNTRRGGEAETWRRRHKSRPPPDTRLTQYNRKVVSLAPQDTTQHNRKVVSPPGSGCCVCVGVALSRARCNPAIRPASCSGRPRWEDSMICMGDYSRARADGGARAVWINWKRTGSRRDVVRAL